MADMRYMEKLDDVAADSVALIREKTETYRDSWKVRGGQGAWFTTVRPWDRLEQIVERHGGDVLAAVGADPTGEDGSALACLRDIRNYTILIEAEARVSLGVGRFGPPLENKSLPEKFRNSVERSLADAVERARPIAEKEEHHRRVEMLKKLGYGVWGLVSVPGKPPSYKFTEPGQHVKSEEVHDPSLWPFTDEEAAWRAAWEHCAAGMDEGTRVAGTPEDGGHHARQPLEDAGDPSEAAPASTLPQSLADALRSWLRSPQSAGATDALREAAIVHLGSLA